MEQFDVVVIGAGAAGLMCAGVAGQMGRKVALLDHSSRLAEKIRISGGGRCNFTNLHVSPANYLSQNPHFCRSALARYTPNDFLDLLTRHRVPWHEKHKGQLFCDRSADDVIDVLCRECRAGGVVLRQGCSIGEIGRETRDGIPRFRIATNGGELQALHLVIATGGMSIPKIGASDFGYRIARQFDVPLIDPRPGLVPLIFDTRQWGGFVDLAGISLEADIAPADAETAARLSGAKQVKARGVSVTGRFREDVLWTHRGLSGPGILQVSSYWAPGTALALDLLPERDVATLLLEAKASSRKNLANILGQWLPMRLVEHWLTVRQLSPQARLADFSDRALHSLGASLNRWEVYPSGSEGYRKAEVTCGGVDTRALSSTSMMVQAIPGLYFIGEVIDVTGWLGGYNFQWAWASAVAAARAIATNGAGIAA